MNLIGISRMTFAWCCLWFALSPVSGQAALNINFGQIFGAGLRASTIAAGDLNGDGALDLAIANIYGNSITIAYNNGSARFAKLEEIPLAGGVQHPVAVAAGDLNGDGLVDLAAVQVQYIDNTITPLRDSGVVFFFNQGDGTFSQSVMDVRGVPSSALIADINSDGQNDVIVGNNGETSFDFVGTGDIVQFDAGVDLFLNQGNNTFAASQSLDADGSVVDVAVLDYNHDGMMDVVGINQGTPSIDPIQLILTVSNPGITLFPGTAAGVKTLGTTGVKYMPWSMGFGDFDKDGNADLAITLVGKSDPTNFLSFLGQDASVELYRNTGSGYAWWKSVPMPGVAYSVQVHDYDLDGDDDLAVTVQEIIVRVDGNELVPSLRLFENDGQGGFTETGSLSLQEEPRYACQGDFDNDGDADLAVLCSIQDSSGIQNAVYGQAYVFINDALTGVVEWELY
ncbi:MAG: VCBS repeat-containing protein [Candidatus Omnitrophota bacterium]